MQTRWLPCASPSAPEAVSLRRASHRAGRIARARPGSMRTSRPSPGTRTAWPIQSPARRAHRDSRPRPSPAGRRPCRRSSPEDPHPRRARRDVRSGSARSRSWRRSSCPPASVARQDLARAGDQPEAEARRAPVDGGIGRRWGRKGHKAPPSTIRVWAVIPAALSEARNRQGPTRSSGSSVTFSTGVPAWPQSCPRSATAPSGVRSAPCREGSR